MEVIIVDDDDIVCSSLKIILEAGEDIQVVATENSGEDAIISYNKYLPDVLIMDIRMSEMSGLEAGEKILSNHPDAKILYLTTFLEDEYIIKALNMGAKGYMLKQNFNSLLPTIKAIQSGQNVYGNEIVTKIPRLMNYNIRKSLFKDNEISDKEYTIIQKIAEGLSNKEISEQLFLSQGTIRNYISIILEKLDLRDRTQIAIEYYKRR